MNKKYLQIGLPIGLAAVIAGVLLGIFLPGGEETATAPNATTATEEAGAPSPVEPADGAESEAAATGAASTSESASAPTVSGTAEAPAGEQPAPDAAAVAALDQPGTTGTEPTTGATARVKPSFDVVRIDPKGGTVMAGRAEPGAEVIITDGEREVGRAKANERGEWVYTQDTPMEAGDRQLSLKDSAVGGAESEEVVVVSVPEAKAGEEKQALAVLQPREGGASVVLQLPEEKSASVDGASPTSVDSVDYSNTGEITIAGRAAPGAELNVYFDNQLAGRVKADEQGRWKFVPGAALGEGPHQFRVDSIDQTGKVIARAETPIARSPAEKLALIGETLVIVQPGNSLWRIARRTYGGGVHYSDIFRANRDQIRDPDLIYPGQIIAIPPLS